MSELRFQEPVTSLGKKVYAKNSEAINRSIESEILESKLVPKWEEGLRAEIRQYFDEV